MKTENHEEKTQKHFWLSSRRLTLDCSSIITVSVTPGVHAKHRAGENSFASCLIVPRTPDKMRLNNHTQLFSLYLITYWLKTYRMLLRSAHSISSLSAVTPRGFFFGLLCLWNWINSSQCANNHTGKICKCTLDPFSNEMLCCLQHVGTRSRHTVTTQQDPSQGFYWHPIASSYIKNTKVKHIKLIWVQEVKALLWK